MSGLHDLLSDVAETLPVAPVDRADRALRLMRRRRRARFITAGAVLAVTVLTFVLVSPLAARLALRQQLGPAGVPDQVFPVPLHAPTVGPGAPLGQPASVLMGGLPRSTGWFGSSCCSIAVVGASTDVSAFLDLPGVVPGDPRAPAARLSYDGRTVAYGTGHGVALLDLLDGRLRSIAPPGQDYVRQVLGWSSDGSWLLLVTNPSGGSGGGSRLAVAKVDGSAWVTMALPAEWRESPRAAAISPYGITVAYVQDGQLWLVPVAGDRPTAPTVTGLDNPQVAFASDNPEVAVLEVAPGPSGTVERGAKRNVVVVSSGPGDGPSPNKMGGGWDSVDMLAHSDIGSTSDLMVVGTSGAFALLRFDEGDGSRTTIAPLPEGIDPQLVDVAADLLTVPTRHAHVPSDPSDGSGVVALGLGLAVAVVLPLVLLRQRRRR